MVISVGCSDATEEEPKERDGPALPPRPTVQFCLPDAALSPEPLAKDDDPGAAPATLSATGCFADITTHEPAPDLVPFDVNSPLWTDSAKKDRYFVIPPTEKITLESNGVWTFPIGSVLLKTFSYELQSGGFQPAETRLMIHREQGWEFHAYAWNDEGTEAFLLADSDTRMVAAVVDGKPTTVAHYFPDRYSCTTCHGSAVDTTLGPRTAQLNRKRNYDGLTTNQIAAFEENELLDATLPKDLKELPQLPDPRSGKGSLEGRARAYLHANCSHCHQPGGWIPPSLDMDLRFELPFVDTNTCDVGNQFGLQNSIKRIDPGSPDTSLIVQRMQTTEVSRMPPVGTGVVDEPALKVIRAWIASLSSCP